MSSVVLALQKEVTQSDCDIVSVLRRAHLIAAKLNLNDFNQWIVNELNGYDSEMDVPEYRCVPGQLKAFNPSRGWIPVMLSDPKVEEYLSHPIVLNSLSEIISLCKGSGSSLVFSLTAEKQKVLNARSSAPIQMQMAIHVSKSAAADIIEKVKNTLIEWTLELEAKGILGDEMSFNEQEKEIAKTMPQQVNNYYGPTNVINGDKIQANAGNTVTAYFDYELVRNAVDEIDDSIQKSEELSQEDKEEALELLREINSKIDSRKKGTVIKAALIGLKDFLISAGAGLTAGIIQAKILGLF
ncbi:MAG: ABC transporter substrate-binding protein [Saccharofermentans sp.]|nr:ABC transporter substrate-binding protein [Saccharofermentans sp.]